MLQNYDTKTQIPFISIFYIKPIKTFYSWHPALQVFFLLGIKSNNHGIILKNLLYWSSSKSI